MGEVLHYVWYGRANADKAEEPNCCSSYMFAVGRMKLQFIFKYLNAVTAGQGMSGLP